MNVYGFLIGLAIVIGIGLAYLLLRYRKYNPELVFDVAIICLPLAFIGLRAYYVLFDVISGNNTLGWWFTDGRIFGFVREGERLRFRGLSGLAIYGGLIGAALGAAFIVRPLNKRKKNPLDQMTTFQMLDLFLVLVILGQAIGRWGNFANQEIYGRQILNPSFQWFPLAVRIGNNYFQALFFYESMMNLIGFAFMLWFLIGRRKSFDGFIFASYCIWYGLTRAIIESMRDTRFVMRLWGGGPPVNMVISIGLIITGLGIIAYHVYSAKKAGKKFFLFVDEGRLDESFYGFEKTIIYLRQKYKDREEIEEADDGKEGFSLSREKQLARGTAADEFDDSYSIDATNQSFASTETITKTNENADNDAASEIKNEANL